MTVHCWPSGAVIAGIETANPPFVLTQHEILSFLTDNAGLSALSLRLYRKFLSAAGIQRRHIAVDDPKEVLNESVDEKIGRYERWAVRLSCDAAQKLLTRLNCATRTIDAVFVATCTGYLCPGLSTYVSQELGMRQDVYTLDLVGLGCGGALPALRAGDDFLNRYPGATVLVIAAEVCSAAIHWAEEPELILSNAIFSDGAAAVLLAGRQQTPGLRIRGIASLLWPHFRDALRFKYVDARLCNVLSPRVPQIAADALDALYKTRSRQAGAHYAFHASGRKVLDSIQQRLGLSDAHMLPSRRILNDYGNMSSPSVLFVLKEILNQGLHDKDRVMGFAFGAGFSASLLEAEWVM